MGAMAALGAMGAALEGAMACLSRGRWKPAPEIGLLPSGYGIDGPCMGYVK